MPKPTENKPDKPTKEERQARREEKQQRMLDRYTGEDRERYLINTRPKNRIRTEVIE